MITKNEIDLEKSTFYWDIVDLILNDDFNEIILVPFCWGNL